MKLYYYRKRQCCSYIVHADTTTTTTTTTTTYKEFFHLRILMVTQDYSIALVKYRLSYGTALDAKREM